jgi:hypothetical protein
MATAPNYTQQHTGEERVHRWWLGLHGGQGGPWTGRRSFSLEGAADTAFSDFCFPHFRARANPLY